MEAFPLKKAIVVNTQHSPYIDILRQIGSRHKVSVTRKALHNQLFNEILTDTETARKLLEYAKS